MLKTLALMAILAAPAVASAQTTPTPPPPPSPPISDSSIQAGIARNLYEMRRQSYVPIDTRIFQENLNRRARANLTPIRLARADRVSLLIDGGDCAAAIALARAEGDRAMTRQARALCRARERNSAL